MAGREYAGYESSVGTLFHDASMIYTPQEGLPAQKLEWVKEMFSAIGCSKQIVTTARYHDQMIAYTSQLAHVVSNTYVKSPTAKLHHGFSAGSYHDLTRVARLDETMWTELFLLNRDCLLKELDTFQTNLAKYREALEQKDEQLLCRLLREGRQLKEQID